MGIILAEAIGIYDGKFVARDPKLWTLRREEVQVRQRLS